MAWNANKKRTVKKSITKGLFEYIKETNPNKVFKCYLCLPSTKAADVKEALRQGYIRSAIVQKMHQAMMPKISAI